MIEVEKLKHRQALKKLYNKRKATGICYSCAEPAVIKRNGKRAIFCADHLELHKLKARKRQGFYNRSRPIKLPGICIKCPKPIVLNRLGKPSLYCLVHLDEHRQKEARRHKNSRKFTSSLAEVRNRRNHKAVNSLKEELGYNITPEVENFVQSNLELFLDSPDRILGASKSLDFYDAYVDDERIVAVCRSSKENELFA